MKISDTLTNQKKELEFSDKVRIYLCGVTVYDQSHIGHARTIIVFDTLRRFLEANGTQVELIQNFTDVDDKIINRAKEQGESASGLSTKYIQTYFEDSDRLNIRRATNYPKATEHIDDMINLIQNLVDKESAYVSKNGVYFRVSKFSEYGKLSKKKTEDLESGARIEVDESKESPLDFALWKFSDGQPNWESPWGKGRPGWHIECSAMSIKYLGKNFEIHGGGRDLIFPHHENEIAQSEGFSDNPPFSNIWMHNGLINLKSEKMSKSIGNIISIDDLLKKYSAAAIRMFFISGNYKNPLEYDDAILISNEKAINRLKQTLNLSSSDSLDELNPDKFINKFNQSMSKDLNTSLALGSIFEMSRSINQSFNKNINISKSQLALAKLLNILGIDTDSENETNNNLDTKEIEDLINLRNKHRLDKDYKKADEIRDKLEAMGIAIYDSDDGTKWSNI